MSKDSYFTGQQYFAMQNGAFCKTDVQGVKKRNLLHEVYTKLT